jgi:O-antigen/teichoic acid export membrane protein
MKNHRSLGLTALTVLAPLFLQLFYIRYVSYSVDKDIYGNFVLLQTLVVALSYVLLQIPTSAYSRFYNEAVDKVSYVNEFRTLLILINILSLFVIFIFGLIYLKFRIHILLGLFFFFLLLNNFAFNKEIFLLNLDRRSYLSLSILESAAKYLCPIGGYYLFGTLFAFVMGLVLGYLVSFIFLMLKLQDYPFSLTFNLKHVRKYFIYAYPVIITASLSWGINLSDRYFIDFFMETQDVAVYAILAQVAGFGSILGQAYGLYVNPIMFKKYEANRTEALIDLDKYIRYLLICFALIFTAVLFLPRVFFTLLVEPEIINDNLYYYSFIILVLSSLMAVTQNAFAMYFVLVKKLEIITYAYVIAFVANFIGNFYIDTYGIIAASISTLVAFMIINLVQYLYVKKAIRP